MCDLSDIYYDDGSDNSSNDGIHDGAEDSGDGGDTANIYSHSLPSLD